MLLVDD
jgi:hypothetical protein